MLADLVCGQSKQGGEETGTRLVNYEVDGTVHSASLTYVDGTGKIKQLVIDLPYKSQFFAPYGAFVSILAQKRVTKKLYDSIGDTHYEMIDDGRQGRLHVLIRIGGVPFREAETEDEFGIAKADGTVPK